MFRHAFKMQLRPGCEEEYKRRHDALWPEMLRQLHGAGISDYSIFLDRETLTLFAVQKRTDDNTAADLPNTEAVKRWWAYMQDIMECNSDHSPVEKPLDEMFHMDQCGRCPQPKEGNRRPGPRFFGVLWPCHSFSAAGPCPAEPAGMACGKNSGGMAARTPKTATATLPPKGRTVGSSKNLLVVSYRC